MDELLLLGAHEARVLGVLIEKSLTTPDQYPLSLNAVTAGCNQKSNRDPVLALGESEVRSALEKLFVRHYAGHVHPAGGRVEKYRHNAAERLGCGTPQIAILAELLMRGPQTQGELRTRASRMHPFGSLAELDDALAPMIERGLVARHSPAPGSRAERYLQLVSPDLHALEAPAAVAAAAHAPPAPSPGLAGRVDALETEVATLRRRFARLAEQLGEPLGN